MQNYIAQINQFHAWLETNYLCPYAQLLWFKLLNLCNKCGWADWVQVDTVRLMAMVSVESTKTAFRARDALVEAGLIEYRKGKKGYPSRYRMIFFQCKLSTKNDTKNGTKNDTENVPNVTPKTTHINKLKHKHKQDIENIKRNSEIPDLFNSICKDLPSIRGMTDSRESAVLRAEESVISFGGWEAYFSEVQSSDFLTGRDGKWHGCGFDWILKPSNMQKIMEGTYRNKRNVSEECPASYDIDEFERRIWNDPIVFKKED